jgi:hypothetical protein
MTYNNYTVVYYSAEIDSNGSPKVLQKNSKSKVKPSRCKAQNYLPMFMNGREATCSSSEIRRSDIK